MKRIKLLLAFESLILIAMGIALIVRWRSSQELAVSIADWKSDYAAYDDLNGWNFNEDTVQTKNSVDVLYGPFIDLKKGTYSVDIEYHCDQNQSSLVSAEDDEIEGQSENLRAGTAILSKNFDKVSYDFEAKEDMIDFEVLVKYNGKGHLQINNITICPSFKGSLRNICFVFSFFVCLDLYIILRDAIQRNRMVLLALLAIVGLSSLPLSVKGIGRGHDVLFHLMRIEGISREIRWGNIPVRMSSKWFEGFGYPVSVYYGDLLLYVPAVMRLVGFSVTAAYKFFVFGVNVGTAVITYFCMKSICKKKEIALLSSLVYCTAPYRLVDIYTRAAVGEFCAMMFFPIIAAAVYKIYTEDVSEYDSYKKNSLLLAIGMSGLIGTHILSLEMAVLFLAITCLVLFKSTFRKNTMKVYLAAVMETVVFSAYFLIPFLDYFMNVSVKVNRSVQARLLIQSRAPSIADLFSFFTEKNAPLTPGLALMTVFIMALALWIKEGKNWSRRGKVLTILSGIALLLATDLFPWDHLITNYRFGIWLSQVQIPWRYIGIAVITLTLLLGLLLVRVPKEKAETIASIIVIACCLTTFFFAGNYDENADFTFYYDGEELDTYAVVGGEYVREGSDPHTLTSQIGTENVREVSIESRQGSSMKIRCAVSEQGAGTICIPMFYYKGYRAVDDSGKEYPVGDGDNCQIQIEVPPGFSGTLLIEYREPWYWRVAELISLFSAVGLCVVKGRMIYQNEKLVAGH